MKDLVQKGAFLLTVNPIYNSYHDNRNMILSFTIRPDPIILC